MISAKIVNTGNNFNIILKYFLKILSFIGEKKVFFQSTHHGHGADQQCAHFLCVIQDLKEYFIKIIYLFIFGI